MTFFRFLLMTFGKYLLRLRYKIEVKGLDKLKEHEWKNGILFLPNHPAEMDPIIVMSTFFQRFKPRPLVVEYFYHMTGASVFMKMVNALPIPSFETSASKWKKKKADEVMETIVTGLHEKENFLIYPSGHLRRNDREQIGGSSFVHKVISSHPEVHVVLVRLEGLWGSTFSRAVTGYAPDFWKVLLHGAWTVIKNGIFFVPKRTITITVEVDPEGLPKNAPRLEFNKFLENWYNQYQIDGKIQDEEPKKFVPFSFWNAKDLPKVIELKSKSEVDYNFTVPQDMRDAVYKKLSELSGVKVEEIDETKNLSSDIGLDSLDVATMHAFLDQKYGVVEISPAELLTVNDLFALSLGKMQGSQNLGVDEGKNKYSGWPKEGKRKEPEFPRATTISQGILETCDRMGSAYALADRLSGPMTYKRLKIAIILFADLLKEKDDKYIGVMLPASSATYIIVFAILLAGKVPVMLNWTTGKRSLDYAHNLMDLKTVITSRAFLGRVSALELSEEFERDLVYAEDLRKKITAWTKIKAALKARKSAKKLAKEYKLEKVTQDDPAVLLFTSGTESYPKAVPLTHYNVLNNLKSADELLTLHSHDCLYGVLPAFHSFGFSVTGMFPLLAGVKAFFSPDPTDAKQMAKDAEEWGISIICLAPTFYQNLFAAADKEQLKSIRLFVSGAEKAPNELFEYVMSLGTNAKLLEGYGITECSPVVTVNDPNGAQEGVGKPIPGMVLCTINPETGEKLEQGEVGEVCIKGHSVFNGYMTPSNKPPFITIAGERWYRSGDLGKIAKSGSLLLMGRIKRFVKIGGEMISLTSVEETVRGKSIEKSWDPKKGSEPSVAAAVRNPETNKPEIVLFTTFPLTKEDANAVIREEGFGRIVKIADVRTLQEIPLTGTGKVHFRKLDEMVAT